MSLKCMVSGMACIVGELISFWCNSLGRKICASPCLVSCDCGFAVFSETSLIIVSIVQEYT